MSNAALTEISPRSTVEPTHISEDWLAVILGLAIFVLGLAALIHVDLIGWVVNTSVWSSFSQALGPASKNYARMYAVKKFHLILCCFGSERFGLILHYG